MSEPISSISDTTANQKAVAKTKGILRTAWLKCTEAEETTRMLRILMKSGVGTNDLERFVAQQNNSKRAKKGKRGGREGGRQV